MKLNNKGITLAELIVSFALLMIILVGLFNIIMEVRSDLAERQMAKEIRDYDNLMVSRIQGDLIKNNVKDCTSDDENKAKWECINSEDTVVMSIILGKNQITYNGVVYKIPYSDNNIFSYNTDNKIEKINSTGDSSEVDVLKITFRYKYVNDDEEFGFTIVHPLEQIQKVQ